MDLVCWLSRSLQFRKMAGAARLWSQNLGVIKDTGSLTVGQRVTIPMARDRQCSKALLTVKLS
jgi:hypothetical protein